MPDLKSLISVASCMLLLTNGGGVASAQSRIYAGASAGLEEGQRGSLDIDRVPGGGGHGRMAVP